MASVWLCWSQASKFQPLLESKTTLVTGSYSYLNFFSMLVPCCDNSKYLSWLAMVKVWLLKLIVCSILFNRFLAATCKRHQYSCFWSYHYYHNIRVNYILWQPIINHTFFFWFWALLVNFRLIKK